MCVNRVSTGRTPQGFPLLHFALLFLLFWLLYGDFLCNTALCIFVYTSFHGDVPLIWLSSDSSDRAKLGSSKCRHQNPFCFPHTALKDGSCMIAGWNSDWSSFCHFQLSTWKLQGVKWVKRCHFFCWCVENFFVCHMCLKADHATKKALY